MSKVVSSSSVPVMNVRTALAPCAENELSSVILMSNVMSKPQVLTTIALLDIEPWGLVDVTLPVLLFTFTSVAVSVSPWPASVTKL